MAPKSVPVPMITRVRLKNFRSIAECDVELGPLTILVGPNGSGKSNFVKALDFVADALSNGLESAVRRQGGMDSVVSRWALEDPDATLRIGLEVDLPKERQGKYALTLRRTSAGGFRLAEESCEVVVSRSPFKTERFVVDEQRGQWTNTRGYVSDPRCGLTSRVLTLPHHADHVHFGSVYQALVGMSFYSFHVAEMRRPQEPDGGERLSPDGDNIASVLDRMSAPNEHGWSPGQQVDDWLAVVTPGIVTVRSTNVAGYQALQFEQRPDEGVPLWTFSAGDMSYGALRTLGVLVALYQGSMQGGSPVTLVGIEEPETAIHPGAATAILEAMDEASLTTQVLATSHSITMLDYEDLDPNILRAVVLEHGRTAIGPVDAVSQRRVRDRLYSAGELLRMSQLAPATGTEDLSREAETASPR